MKYEAKHYGGSTTVPVSTASGLPWVSIPQSLTGANNDAMEISQNAVDQAGNPITGAHLVTEAEWLTVAQNVLSVASDWSNGTAGSGYIPRGNSNGSAAMDGTTDLTGINKRTLTLTNGEVIWDLAGNVWDWTAGQTSGVGNQPGVAGAGYSWRQWTAITTPGNLISDPSPVGTGISGLNAWNASNGVGSIFSDSDQAGLRGFRRGGDWGSGGGAGALLLSLNDGPSNVFSPFGFRFSR